MLKDVNVELPCGHIIEDLRCWELQNRDEYPCNKMVTKVVPKCGHTVKVNCHIVMDSFLCPVQCGTILDCKHICKAGATHARSSLLIFSKAKLSVVIADSSTDRSFNTHVAPNTVVPQMS
jgi:hypothetical protein